MKQDTSNEALPPVEVPAEALSADTIKSLIESFILREGTDYGRVEVDHETKVEQIERQLRSGKIKIVFEPTSETVTLVTERDWKKFKGS